MKYKLSIIIFILLLIPMITAQYSDCNIYGNCNPVKSQESININNTYIYNYTNNITNNNTYYVNLSAFANCSENQSISMINFTENVLTYRCINVSSSGSISNYWNLTNNRLKPLNDSWSVEMTGGFANHTSFASTAGIALGFQSVGESYGTTGKDASYAHAESGGSANAQYAHGESAGSANAPASHAESGGTTTELAEGSHAESGGTSAGISSHSNTGGTANGDYSLASGGSEVNGYGAVGFVEAYNPFDVYFMVGGSTGITDDYTKVPLQEDVTTPDAKLFVSSPDAIFSCQGDITACSDLSETPCGYFSGCIYEESFSCSNTDPACSEQTACEECVDTSYCSDPACSDQSSCEDCDTGCCSIWNPSSTGCCGTWDSQGFSCNGELLDGSCSQLPYEDCSPESTSTYCNQLIEDDIKGLVLQAGVGQTDELLECRDESGTVKIYIDETASILRGASELHSSQVYSNTWVYESSSINGMTWSGTGLSVGFGHPNFNQANYFTINDGWGGAYGIRTYNHNNKNSASIELISERDGKNYILSQDSNLNSTTNRMNGTSDLIIAGSLNVSSWGALGQTNYNVTVNKGSNLIINYTNMTIDANVTFTNLIKLDVRVLPACATATNGTIGRNATKIYFCNGATWNALY